MLFDIFYTVLKMNCIATIISVPVLVIKYFLQKARISRKITIFLWLIIALRLVCPIAISTNISAFNLAFNDKKMPQQAYVQIDNATENDYDVQNLLKSNIKIRDADEFAVFKTGAAIIWFIGMSVILSAGMVLYLMLKKRLRFAVRLRNNIYTADNIPTSFVFGIFFPKIYIPEAIAKNNIQYIVAHEQTHIKRADHITKVLAYIFMAVHWFNPLNWVMFKLFSADLEATCDESVILKIGIENKKDYLNTLITSALINKENKVLFYNVCFSSNPTKRRIKNMLKLKKCPKIITLAGVGICVFAFISFGTNAVEYSSEKGSFTANSSVNNDAFVADVSNTEAHAEQNISIFEITKSTLNKEHTPSNSEMKEAASLKKETTISNSIGMGQKNVDISNIEQEIKANGATKVGSENLVSGYTYAVKEYTFQNSCSGTVSNVTCNENGEISLCFNLNTASLVDITITDSETKEVLDSFDILANDKSSYTFSGLNDKRTYDIIIKGKTQSDWKVEGSYIVY